MSNPRPIAASMSTPGDVRPPGRPSVGVVVPAYNAAATLADCLDAIASMTITADEVVVVDDGSTDRTGIIARASGARVIDIGGGPRGPGNARNVGTAAIHCDFAVFIDADVIVHANALALMLDDLRDNGAAAAFGSYDDRPRSQRASSLYANLRHHYVHQQGRRDATTFWSGLGMIDRQVFLAAGGFDSGRYPRPSIEDVELGIRLIQAGVRIRLVPEAQGKHCKDWRVGNIWRTDIIRRACPWTLLITEGNAPIGDLNLARAEQFKAAIAGAILLSLIAAIIWPAALWLSGGGAIFYLTLNARFLAYIARRTSLPTLIVAALLHWCYHVYASATFVAVFAWAKLTRSNGVKARL